VSRLAWFRLASPRVRATKMARAALLALAFAAPVTALAGEANPVGKVLQLLADLQAKVLEEGHASQKAYAEYTEWCEDRSRSLGFELKTAKREIASLKAAVSEEEAITASLETKVEKLTESIATDEADLKSATEIRSKEAADFANTEKEMMEAVSALERAVAIIEREMKKGGASALQLKSANSLTQALGVLVEASSLSSADGKRLTALLQSSQESEDGDDQAPGAPAVAAYESQSGSIVETLENLLEKGEAQLDEARTKEKQDSHNFQMLKQSLEDELKYSNKELDEAKKGMAESAEKKATAEGDIEETSKIFRGDTASLEDLHHACLTKAQDYEAEVRSRSEELTAISTAKKAISENTAGAEKLSYGLNQASFLQLGGMAISSGADLAIFEAVRLIRDLALKQHAPALTQLASRMAAALRSGRAGLDPFVKVKDLIAGMIASLEKEAEADATHKAYCDKELGETRASKADKTTAIEKLSTKIDQMSSRSAQLKEEVSALQKALSELSATQLEMDKVRSEEKANFEKAKADMEQGLKGVKLALKVLRDYYAKEDTAHEAAGSAGTGIIGVLELVESDFTKGLMERTATEKSSQASYEEETQENKIEKATKGKDVEYKTAEASSLDKSITEATSDRSDVQAELDAVLQYLASLEQQCIAKPEAYETRKARRDAEIAGLKDALKILESQAMLVQRGDRRALRGRQ